MFIKKSYYFLPILFDRIFSYGIDILEEVDSPYIVMKREKRPSSNFQENNKGHRIVHPRGVRKVLRKIEYFGDVSKAP